LKKKLKKRRLRPPLRIEPKFLSNLPILYEPDPTCFKIRLKIFKMSLSNDNEDRIKQRLARQSRSGSIFSNAIDDQTDWNGKLSDPDNKILVIYLNFRSFYENGQKARHDRGVQKINVQSKPQETK
jgi:hypothetical protein